MSKRNQFVPTPVLSACALDGHGKTTFALTAPKPLALFHIDPNTEETVEKAIDSKLIARGDVTLYPVPYPASIFNAKDALQTEAEHAWEDKFIEPLRTVLDDSDVRGVVFDTSTELFELVLMADHGRTVQIMPEMRTKTNYKFKGLLNALKRSGKTIVLLHRLRDAYENKSVNTSKGKEERREKIDGVYEREGFSKTGFHVNVEVALFFDPTREGAEANRYGVKITRCTQRPALILNPEMRVDEGVRWGREKQADGSRIVRASVPWVLSQVYPDIAIDHWT